MPLKKKSEIDSEKVTTKPREPVMVVTEVVEIIDGSSPDLAEKPKVISETQEEQKDTSEVKVQPTKESESTKSSGSLSHNINTRTIEEEAQTKEDSDTKRKVVVKELFTSHDSALDSEITMHEKSSWLTLLMWILVTLIIAALIGAGLIFLVRGGFSNISLTPSPTPTPTMSITPTVAISPTPEVLDKAAIEIQVLNGGGVPGAATKMKNILEKKGYNVVATGNADAYTYKNTEVQVKSGKEAVRLLIQEDLKDTYEIATSTTMLETNDPFVARVIVGEK